MSLHAEVPDEVIRLLAETVALHLDQDPDDRDLALLMCVDAVGFAREYAPDHVGMRARSAATLLLDLACPRLSPGHRSELAIACELAAIGARARAQG